MEIANGKINLTSSCNVDCHCTGFAYTPVCWEETGDTFFSPCVANCNAYAKSGKVSCASLPQIALLDLITAFCALLVLPRMRVCTRSTSDQPHDVDFCANSAGFGHFSSPRSNNILVRARNEFNVESYDHSNVKDRCNDHYHNLGTISRGSGCVQHHNCSR